METMTVTRGLAKIKLLDSRIRKEIEAASLVDIYQNKADKALSTGLSKKEFGVKAKAALESITSLIDNRRAIKNAILRSNAETTVTISGEKMSVSEAIERKNSIEYDKLLLGNMNLSYNWAKEQAEKSRVQVEEHIRKMMDANLGSDTKADEGTYKKIAEPFMHDNQINVLDPLEIKNKKAALDKTIDEFMSEVDFILSESNARTEIEI